LAFSGETEWTDSPVNDIDAQPPPYSPLSRIRSNLARVLPFLGE
jgi:hypothetical protein